MNFFLYFIFNLLVKIFSKNEMLKHNMHTWELKKGSQTRLNDLMQFLLLNYSKVKKNKNK